MHYFAKKAKDAKQIYLLDVGANDGSWTKSVLHATRKRLDNARESIEVHLFEPQPRFVESLDKVIEGWPNAKVHHAAAWKDDKENLTFFLSRASVSASLLPVVARHGGIPRFGKKNIT